MFSILQKFWVFRTPAASCVLALCALGTLGACGSESPVTETLREDLDVTVYHSRVSDGLSDRLKFEVAEDVDSILIEVHGNRGMYSLAELVPPNKRELIEAGNIVTRGARQVPGLVSWLYPNKNGIVAEAGEYTLTIRGVDAFGGSRLNEDIEIFIYTPKKKPAKTCGIHLDFLVDDAALGKDTFEAAVTKIADQVNRNFRQVGIKVADYTTLRINMQSSDINLGDGTAVSVVDDVLRRAIPLGAARKSSVHIMLVRRIGGSSNVTFDPLGYSMGLPGPYAYDLKTSAVLVSTEKYANGGGLLDADGLASSLTHEIGHFLGLYHTSERNGLGHDPLGDTEQCDDEFSCNQKFRRNIMTSSFWLQGKPPSFRNQFSKEQGIVMRGHPLCEPMDVTIVNPPIERCTTVCSPPNTCAVFNGQMSCERACDPSEASSCSSGSCRSDELGTYVCSGS